MQFLIRYRNGKITTRWVFLRSFKTNHKKKEIIMAKNESKRITQN
jgi:hypothetical protein